MTCARKPVARTKSQCARMNPRSPWRTQRMVLSSTPRKGFVPRTARKETGRG
jgi:hypothetical protein